MSQIVVMCYHIQPQRPFLSSTMLGCEPLHMENLTVFVYEFPSVQITESEKGHIVYAMQCQFEIQETALI